MKKYKNKEKGELLQKMATFYSVFHLSLRVRLNLHPAPTFKCIGKMRSAVRNAGTSYKIDNIQKNFVVRQQEKVHADKCYQGLWPACSLRISQSCQIDRFKLIDEQIVWALHCFIGSKISGQRSHYIDDEMRNLVFAMGIFAPNRAVPQKTVI